MSIYTEHYSRNTDKFRRRDFIIILLCGLFLFSYFTITPFLLAPRNNYAAYNIFYLSFNDSPQQIHAMWSHQNTSNTFTIMWKTSKLERNYLKFDVVSHQKNSSPYAWINKSNAQKYSFLEGYVHAVILTNLTPNTTYYFVCGSDKGGWSQELQFRLPSLNPEKISFVVGGDGQENILIRDEISQLMAQYNPEFVIFCGDAVSDGKNQRLWDFWFDGMHQYWKSNNTIIPIIPSLGNHEKDSENYFALYSLPNTERYYSIDYSPYLHIVCLDSEIDISGDQLNWLKNDLRNYNDTLWKIVFFHQSPYSSGAHGSRIDIRQTWSPLFDIFNITAVFCGHNHFYQRSNPIRDNKTETSYLNGTMYVTTGGWGGSLYQEESSWFTAYGESTHHFCFINISITEDNSTFELNQIRLNNTIGDSIFIFKDLSDSPIII